ncbi:MAG: hypothetical protein WC821_00765 [archaeon]|jgi:hypothetical protein
MRLPRRNPVKNLFTKNQLKTTHPKTARNIAELQFARKKKKASTSNSPRVDITQVRIEEHAKKVKERAKAQTKKFKVQKPATFWDRLLGRR